MDMRPQGHDIIRTWLFSTMVRSHYEFGVAPWSNAALSGWILDPDRKKMSKSKGNVVTPLDLFETYGTDAVRYWVGLGSPRRRHRVQRGPDEGRPQARHQAAQRHQVRVDVRRCRFGRTGRQSRVDAVTNPLDLSMLAKLDETIAEATAGFEAFDYARALERTEAFFWWFCDDYVELVKGRAYNSQGDGGAPRRPVPRCRRRSTFDPTPARPDHPVRRRGVVELVERRQRPRQPRGRRRAGWAGDPALLDPIVEVLTLVRRAKTEAKVSQRADVASLTVHADDGLHPVIELGRADLADAGSITEFARRASSTRCPATSSWRRPPDSRYGRGP